MNDDLCTISNHIMYLTIMYYETEEEHSTLIKKMFESQEQK